MRTDRWAEGPLIGSKTQWVPVNVGGEGDQGGWRAYPGNRAWSRAGRGHPSGWVGVAGSEQDEERASATAVGDLGVAARLAVSRRVLESANPFTKARPSRT